MGWVHSPISRLLYRASGNWQCFVKVWAEAGLCGWQILFTLLPLPVPFWKVPAILLGSAGREGNYTSWSNNHGLPQPFLRQYKMNISLISPLLCYEASFRQVKRHTLRDQTQATPCSLMGTVVWGQEGCMGTRTFSKAPNPKSASYSHLGTKGHSPPPQMIWHRVPVWIKWQFI